MADLLTVRQRGALRALRLRGGAVTSLPGVRRDVLRRLDEKGLVRWTVDGWELTDKGNEVIRRG